MTRHQQLMTQAISHMQSIGPDAGTRQAYGGLCHRLPALILKNGLCQTVAFLDAQAAGGGVQAQAHALVREHLAKTLGRTANGLVAYVAGAPIEEYMRSTRTVLVAWTFYKRFAVSLLGVEEADAGEDTE